MRRAWDDLVRFVPYWTGLFEYCRQTGQVSNNLRRQQNCCIEVLAAHHDLMGLLPSDWPRIGELTFWPDQPGEQFDRDPFDAVFFLRWKAISGQTIDPDVVEQAMELACRRLEGRPADYPSFLIYEGVIRYGLGTTDQQQFAAKGLAGSCLFQPDLARNSILSVLALRAVHVLERAGHSAPPQQEPERNSILARLFVALKERPDNLIARCPY